MMTRHVITAVVLLLTLALPSLAGAEDPTIAELLGRAGIPPQGDRRGQMDTVGFASTAAQMDGVLARCGERAAPREAVLRARHGWTGETAFIAAVCPHDDYAYAGRLYSLLLPRVTADHVVIFGVFHKARIFSCRDQLVFDAYAAWHGPQGPVKVSPLREEILQRLPAADVVVDNEMQMVEHSVEAIVPFLQAYNPDVEIVSILVPYMDWETMDRLAASLSAALSAVMEEKGWQLGRDVALVCSCDAVHYGDAGWGGADFAPFGTEVAGYMQAVNRDIRLAEENLCGPVRPERLRDFLYRCVNPEDVTDYTITWCGRFSVPFGLNVASRLTDQLEGRPLAGTLLDYGTSVSEAALDLGDLGLGVTAPSNFHHFVGYAAIGYR